MLSLLVAFEGQLCAMFYVLGSLASPLPELLFSYWKGKVRPNDVEMARNLMCTLLLTVLKDIAVFCLILTRSDA